MFIRLFDEHFARHFESHWRETWRHTGRRTVPQISLETPPPPDFIILNRHNYTNMGNLGNGLLQDSPIVYYYYYFIIIIIIFYKVWTPYAA